MPDFDLTAEVGKGGREMKRLLVIGMAWTGIMAILALTGCTDTNNATRILAQQGYKNIRITGWRPFACSDDDSLHTGFEATSPAGVNVTGTVCSGLMFKASTIRLD